MSGMSFHRLDFNGLGSVDLQKERRGLDFLAVPGLGPMDRISNFLTGTGLILCDPA